MSKILIIEDDEQRIDEFKKHLSKHDLFIAKKASWAYNYLAAHCNEPFDYVFLDHDLDEDNTGCNGEGIDVANRIIRIYADDYKNTVFIIHSMNTVGAENMAKVLERAGFTTQTLPYSCIVYNGWKLNL